MASRMEKLLKLAKKKIQHPVELSQKETLQLMPEVY